MKKFGLCAALVAFAVSAGATTGFDGKQFQTNAWFNVSFSGSAIVENHGSGEWNETPGVSDSVLNIDTDTDESLIFTPTAQVSYTDYETVTARINPRAGDGEPDALDANAQAAFTLAVVNDNLQAMGWTSAGWKNLSYKDASTPFPNTSLESLTNGNFTLYMDFAKENSSRYIRYSVQLVGEDTPTVLTDSEGNAWFATKVDHVNNISFSGVGKVATFSAAELDEIVPITFSDVEFTYLTSYETATTVVANVSGVVKSGTTFTLNFGGTEYANGVYDNGTGTVTFYNVGSNLNLGDNVSYTITASGMATGTTGSQTTTVGTTYGDWICEDATHNNSGTWASTISYENSVAALDNNTFTPTNPVGDAVVTVVSTVSFGDIAESLEMGDESYAAIRIVDNSGTPTFQIWAKTAETGNAEWINVANDNVTVAPETTYEVTSVFDFVQGKCQFYVDGHPLANNSQTSFYLANDVRKMSAVNFNGKGSLTSLYGSYVEAEKIVEDISGTGVPVDSDWVADNLRDKTFAEARTLLDPESTVKTPHAGAEYNYFECYALGIDPDVPEEAPLVVAVPGSDGKFDVSLEGISVPAGVTVTATLKTCDTPNGTFAGELTAKAVGTEEGTERTDPVKFDPATGMGEGNVKYLKMEIDIGATQQQGN